MIELIVKVRDEHTSLTNFHVIYDPITLSLEDPLLNSLVKQAIEKFKASSQEAPEIKISCKMIWQ